MQMRKTLKRIASAVITASLMLAVFTMVPVRYVSAEASATVESTNPWGDGGQITLNLSGCSGYAEITVVADFGGTVSTASGWGFDSYEISGSQVTATVSADGANSWAFDGNVGIQVTGSDISSITLVSVSGSGTATVPVNPGGDEQNTGSAVDYNSIDLVQGDDWLTTDGDRIVDQNGTEVWLTGCNWFNPEDNEPVAVYGPPEDFEDYRPEDNQNEDVYGPPPFDDYDPADDLPEPVYGPPEDFGLEEPVEGEQP